MNGKHLKSVPYIMLAAILAIMYGTAIGIPGIAQYWDGFELLDMQWFYSANTVTTMLQNIGADGVRHYLYYFVVDAAFIILLFFVQLQMSKTVSEKKRKIYRFLVALVGVRGVLDLIEDLLLSLTITERLPISVVSFASCVTALKFLALFLWGATFLISTLHIKFTEKSKGVTDEKE